MTTATVTRRNSVSGSPGAGRLKTWVVGVMRGVGSEVETIETVPADAPSPEEQLSKDDIKRHLMDAINKLPARERAVIALYYYEGLKFAEIGSVLRISESRVSQVHTEILAMLRLGLASLKEEL